MEFSVHTGAVRQYSIFSSIISTPSGKDTFGCQPRTRRIFGGAIPGEFYQGCCTSQAFKGSALIVRLIPGMSAVWNDNNGHLEYTDRWVNFGAWTQPDPCAPLSQGGGMNPARPGECILDPDLTPGSTFLNFSCQPGSECGRFPELHGTNQDFGYWSSNFVNAAWPVYRPLAE